MPRNLLLLAALVVTAAVGVSARAPAQETTSLPGLDSADTVRTNLFLVEALMGEIARDAARSLPAPPATVDLQPKRESPEDELFGTVLADVLGEMGYRLYLSASGTADTTAAPSADAPEVALRYRIEQVALAYPETKRRFGIWRQWVAREMEISAYVTVVETDSDRLLLNERLVRSYHDRIPNDDFEAVGSPAYTFTDAHTQESGWGRYLETAVVLGTLTGLVAIYFSNTGE
jgi:hypothetical protein